MESAINMNSLIAIGIGVVLAIIIFKVVKSIIKAVGFIILVAVALYFWQGGTVEGLAEKGKNTKEDVIDYSLGQYFDVKNTAISDLVNTYCADGRENETKCKCVVTPVYNDLTSRLSASELKQLESNKELKIREIRNSITNQAQTIKSCGSQAEGKKFMNSMKWLIQLVGNAIQE